MNEEIDEETETEDPIEMLREIKSAISEISLHSLNKNDHYRRGFLEGRGLEITRSMDQHPEWWDYGCYCDECRSNA